LDPDVERNCAFKEKVEHNNTAITLARRNSFILEKVIANIAVVVDVNVTIRMRNPVEGDYSYQ
jgi:hypothetical protein